MCTQKKKLDILGRRLIILDNIVEVLMSILIKKNILTQSEFMNHMDPLLKKNLKIKTPAEDKINKISDEVLLDFFKNIYLGDVGKS